MALNFFPFLEGTKEEGEDEQCEPQKTENNTENIEIIDVELGEVCGTWTKKKNPIPATPMFHGGELILIHHRVS